MLVCRFVRVSRGPGKELVDVDVDTPIGREQFEAPNTFSRASFALSQTDNGQVLLTVLSPTSRLKVVSNGVVSERLHVASSHELRGGDVLLLLGDSLMEYRFEMSASAAGSTNKRRKEEPKGVAEAHAEAPSTSDKRSKVDVDKNGKAEQQVVDLTRSSSSSSAAKSGFVPSPFKFYRNLVALEGFHNAQNVLNLRPLFAEPGITRVCLTSYELEADWLLRAFPVLRTVQVFVACRAVPRPCPGNWTHVSPQVPPYGTCHGKLMLLYFGSFKLRVILTSANHIESDHLFKSNAIWTQEFFAQAPRPHAEIGYRTNRNDFGPVLQDYLEKLGVSRSFADLRGFDFSSAAVALVSSVPGTHRELSRYGYARLAQVLGAEGCSDLNSPLIVQCSSVGKLSQTYIDAMSLAIGGFRPKMELIWPTVEFVRTSVQGYGAGGSICFNAKNNNATNKTIMTLKYEGVPERHRISPHIKTMFRLKSSGNVARELSWMYMGSHNLSKSSWGEEQLQGRQFKVLSFEIGVVFIPALISRCAKVPISLVLGKGNVADGPRVPGQIVLPIPYRYPAESYSAKHSGSERPDDMPWQWDVAYHKPDVFGKQWPGIGSI